MKRIFLLISFVAYSLLAEASIPYIIDGTVKGGNNRNYTELSLFAPVFYTENTSLLFGDVRVMHHLPSFKKKKNPIYSDKSYEIKLGLGYRVATNEELVVGTTAYYDLRRAQLSNQLFSQVTLNAHALSPTWQTQANIYIPAGKKEITKTTDVFSGKGKVVDRDVFFTFNQNKVTEKALTGGDLRISNLIPGTENMRLGGLVYHFSGKKSVSGGGIEVDWAINDSLKIEGSYTYDRYRKNNFLLGFRFSFPVQGKSKQSTTLALLSTKVQRDVDIVTSRSLSSVSNNVKQDNILPVYSNDLADLNNPASIDTNIGILSALQDAYDKGKTIIIADENGKEFDYNSVVKITGTDFKRNVDQAKTDAAASLSQNIAIGTIVTNAANVTNPLDRQSKVLGAELAQQDKIGDNGGYYIAGQMRGSVNYVQALQDLFNKYARAGSTPNQSIRVNLPGFPNAEIERAGTLLLIKENNQVYAIIGTDVNSANRNVNPGQLPWNAWFSGQVEQRDHPSVSEAITRETFEESAGSVYISEKEINQAISEGRFLYSPTHKILAIVHPDLYQRYNVNLLASNLNNLRNDQTISSSMKEVIAYHKVPINEFISLQNRMANPPANTHDPAYNVLSSAGNPLRIEYHYARALGIGATNGGGQAIPNAVRKF